MELRGKNVRSWCHGSSDRSFLVDPLSYFSFRPELHAGPALGGAGPKWEQFRSAQLPCHLTARSVESGAGPNWEVWLRELFNKGCGMCYSGAYKRTLAAIRKEEPIWWQRVSPLTI